MHVSIIETRLRMRRQANQTNTSLLSGNQSIAGLLLRVQFTVKSYRRGTTRTPTNQSQSYPTPSIIRSVNQRCTRGVPKIGQTFSDNPQGSNSEPRNTKLETRMLDFGGRVIRVRLVRGVLFVEARGPHHRVSELRRACVQGSGFRVQGSGFRVQGFGSRVWGSGFGVRGSGFRVPGSGFRVQGSGFRVQDSGFRVQGAGFRVQGSGFKVQGSGFRVEGSRFTV